MNTDFTKEKIEYLADLLMIGLTEEETNMVLDEFSIIDKNINLINEIPNIESVEPMTHTLDDFVFELRDDEEYIENDSLEEILSNCSQHENGEVVVPKVVGEC